jgi:thymidylate synthase (FAD)
MPTNEWTAHDGKGRLELLETFGSDLTVVNAARVSFAKEVTEMGDKDEKLISYLAKHDHVSPFFHPQIRLRIKMPIFLAREWFRHTIGFARNEVSRRYVDSTPELWYPSPESLRERDPKLKQGSKDTAVPGAEALVQRMEEHGQACLRLYDELLQDGVAPELARTILPQGMYTEWIETGSLAAYARLCKLRLDPGAQREIRDYANGIEGLLFKAFPVSWKALRSDQ